MSKRNTPPAPQHFDALRALRNKLPAATARPTKPPRPAAEPTRDGEEIDFAAAMLGAKPLPKPNLAEISRPKPVPVPRAKQPEDETPDERAPDAPRDEFASFHDAMHDVIALRKDGRIDPDKMGRRAPNPHPAHEASADTMGAWLDRAENPHDPAALFRHAVGPAAPLRESGRLHLTPPAPAPQPRQREADEQQVLTDSIVAPMSFEDRLDIGDEAAFLRPGIPRRVLTDLRRGRWVVQAELDLHGMDRDEARLSLAQFLALRLTRGERCVRVIHGKGLGSPGRIGVLKQLSRNWLAQREEILAFCQAKPHDGGDGALLVLLRAPRVPG